MADLLLQAAIKDIQTAFTTFTGSAGGVINYNDLVGQSLSDYIKAQIETKASSNTGPYSNVFGDTGSFCANLHALSCWTELSSCVAGGVDACGPPFAGSTTQQTAIENPNNIWCTGEVLGGLIANPTSTAIKNDLVNLSNTLSELNDISSTVGDDMFIEYLNLYRTFKSEDNTDVLKFWYGDSSESRAENQGAPFSTTNRVKVCGTDWKCGEGATCTWTVPAGATRAKFQVWGAGIGTNGGGCCCGGNQYGATGAYAELVIDVTPGDDYITCAGCSCNLGSSVCSSNPPGQGCASFVTGPGICCLNASGSFCYTGNCENLNYISNRTGMAGGTCRRFKNPYCAAASGPCYCSYSEYCFNSSCGTCGVVPVYPNCCETSHTVCSCACLDTNPQDGLGRTHRGIHGGGCLDTNNYGYHTRPPLINADTGLLYTDGCYCSAFTSSTIASCNGNDFDDHPGHGGYQGHTMGGCNTAKHGFGRGGLVQISWA